MTTIMNTVKKYRVNRDKTIRILNIGIRWRLMVGYTLQPLYSQVFILLEAT
jgi:hypothetical protein